VRTTAMVVCDVWSARFFLNVVTDHRLTQHLSKLIHPTSLTTAAAVLGAVIFFLYLVLGPFMRSSPDDLDHPDHPHASDHPGG